MAQKTKPAPPPSQNAAGDDGGDGDNRAVLNWYEDLLRRGVLRADQQQQRAAALLQEFSDDIVRAQQRKSAIRSDWRRFLGIEQQRGDEGGNLYLHGGVGRGKSFLMDGFFLRTPARDKMRVHFHRFMQRFHAAMKTREGEAGALEAAADDIAAKCRLLCFDEFHISDIVDAMILGRLLEALLERGVRFVLTSNYHPDGLYPNGLARERFLPAIGLIKRRFELVALDGETDYRMLHFGEGEDVFLHPLSAKTEKRLRALFDKTACGVSLPPEVRAGNRTMPAVARAPGIAWFTFAALCAEARGQADYLSLADRFPMLIVSQVPKLDSPRLAEASRRFTWLVDILYDRRIKLILSAETSLAELYGKTEGGESGRTSSRLTEMQSRPYWQQGKTSI